MDDINSLVAQMLAQLGDGLDHPQLWQLLSEVCSDDPAMAQALLERLPAPTPTTPAAERTARLVLNRVLRAMNGEQAEAAQELGQLMASASQNRLVQGALYFVNGLISGSGSSLQGRICPIPFLELDVLERSSHLCCASWLPTSVGDLHKDDWQEVWNSDSAQDIRHSVLDGSYRHCNKMTCPVIQGRALLPLDTLIHQTRLNLEGPYAYLGVKDQPIALSPGWLNARRADPPAIINLAYDRSCNLACPSCRSEKYMADGLERERIDAMQERNIEPLLRHAQLAMITGSGDPFASKTFRKLLGWIGPDTTPQLKVKLMTNGLLFTPRNWQQLSKLQEQVSEIKVSIDGVSAGTHEALRTGSQWTVMMENLRFIGELAASRPGLSFSLAFIVQRDNFHEMGAAVDLALSVGATSLHFARLTNWGTYSDQDYEARAITLAQHPRHDEFLRALKDPRMRHPIVSLGDLSEFFCGPDPHKLFPVPGDRRVCYLKNAITTPYIEVGDYTYYDDPEPPEEFERRNVLYHYPFIGDKLIIGKFCSLARGVRFIMNGANHATNNASTYHFAFLAQGWEHIGADAQAHATKRGDTVVGHDVWMGYEACVMPGVSIGNGAVIGTRAVVAKDVPPYAIVAGNPARIIRYRFEPAVIEALQATEWWHWSPDRIARELPGLLERLRNASGLNPEPGTPASFMAEMENAE